MHQVFPQGCVIKEKKIRRHVFVWKIHSINLVFILGFGEYMKHPFALKHI